MKTRQVATGTGDIDWTSESGGPFRPKALRIHFYGGSGVADVTLHLDCGDGEEYDAELFTVADRGAGADMNLVWTDDELKLPSGWDLAKGDALRVTWPSPDSTIRWGLVLDLANVPQGVDRGR